VIQNLYATSLSLSLAGRNKDGETQVAFNKAISAIDEVISEMKSVMGEGLDRFKAAVGIFPERIVFFRDGVSSGQFASIRQTEVQGIKDALDARGFGDKCKLTCIVVQKRHHIRLFPVRGGETDRSGNCCPGTVVSFD
jgi:eukaryotic translation initiation factor 2C